MKLIEYKGGKCCICDYNTYHGALEFHHVDSKTKIKAISEYSYLTDLDEIIKEVDKCLLVCANCHREIHGGFIDLIEILTTQELNTYGL